MATKAPTVALPAPVAAAVAALLAAPSAKPVAAVGTTKAAFTASPSTVYTISGKAAASIRNMPTLQRGCTVAVGAQWRANDYKAPNTRHIVIGVLANLGEEFTYAQAAAALAPLKADATLGSGTPASYIRAFVKCGYLEEV